MAAIDYNNDVVRTAFVKLEARATAAEAATIRSAFTMTNLAAANRVYQRAETVGGSQGKGFGTIPVAVNVTTTGIPFFRIRSSDGTTILQPAAPLQAFTSTGAQMLNVTGVSARLGWFYVDLSVDGTTWMNGTTLVGMGRVVAAGGQSLAVRMFGRMDSQTATNASLGVTISPNGSVYGTYFDSQRSVTTPAWALPADASNYDSTFAAEFLRLEVAAAGVNCGLVAAHPVGGQSITTFIPGGSNNANMRARLDEVGGFETFLWLQGHQDVGTSVTAYQTNLTTLFADITSRNAVRGTAYDRIVNDLPNITSSSYPTPAARQALHVAVSAWCASVGAIYVHPRDIDLVDGIHESQAGGIVLARHFYRATRIGLALPRGDIGPRIASATRAGVSISVPITLPYGATALSSVGAPGTRFSVFAAGTITPALALDATTPFTLNGTNVTLKLASDPGSNQTLDLYFGYPSDPATNGAADMIYDDVTDSDGITVGRHLTPNLAPISIVPGGIVTKVGSDLTPTSMSYGTGATAFGQERIGGYAISSVNGDTFPATNTWTIEGFISVGTNTAVHVAFGQANKGWIGCSADGHLVANYYTAGGDQYLNGSLPSGGGSNPVITDGIRRHVALVVSASGAKLFVNGALVGSAATIAPTTAAGSSKFSIGTLSTDAPADLSTFMWPNSATVDEVAVTPTAKYSANFTAPTAPFTGSEGMTALYHLDGNSNAATY